jgi:hypothetical protein
VRKLLLPLGVLLLALARDTRDAAACGGSYTHYSTVLLAPVLPGADSYDGVQAPEASFLYPYHVAFPDESELLWKFSYEGLEEAPLDDTLLERALKAGEPKRARQAARDLIDDWYALPPVLAAPHRARMMRAVEVLDGGPAPGQSLLALMEQFRRRVPNGWYQNGSSSAPGGFLAQHLQDVKAWRRAHPGHPLDDLAAFWEVRTHYFAGDYEQCWNDLFKLYGKRRTRALAEMRFLLLGGIEPSEQQLDSLTAPVLLASFVDEPRTTKVRFERWWKLSEKTRDGVGRTVLQERLLHAWSQKPKTEPLPTNFPARAERRSPNWGTLRSFILLLRGQPAKACEQLELMAPDPVQAGLLAHCRYDLGKPIEAARTPGLDETEVHYLVQMFVPRAELPKLRNDTNPVVRKEAQFAEVVQVVHQRNYAAAAKLLQVTAPEQAKRLQEVAALQQRGDKLALARALRESGQRLIGSLDPSSYRSVSWLTAAAAPGSSERQNIATYLEATSGSFQSLEPFVEWLEANPRAPGALAVLKEADRAYIELGAYGGQTGLFWEEHLKQHPLALRLRRVGKQIRQTKPAP